MYPSGSLFKNTILRFLHLLKSDYVLDKRPVEYFYKLRRDTYFSLPLSFVSSLGSHCIDPTLKTGTPTQRSTPYFLRGLYNTLYHLIFKSVSFFWKNLFGSGRGRPTSFNRLVWIDFFSDFLKGQKDTGVLLYFFLRFRKTRGFSLCLFRPSGI